MVYVYILTRVYVSTGPRVEGFLPNCRRQSPSGNNMEMEDWRRYKVTFTLFKHFCTWQISMQPFYNWKQCKPEKKKLP